MLFAKENYFNQMYTLHQHQQQYQQASTFADGEDPAYIGIQDRRLQQQQNKADIA